MGWADDFNRYVKQFEEAEESAQDGRVEAQQGRDYFDGNQFTDAEKRTLRRRKQPITPENLIKPKIEGLCGLERQSRTDPKAYPRPVQLPWGEKLGFKGVIDLLTMKAYAGDGKTAVDIPAEYQEQVQTARATLIEAAAEGEDEILMKYLEGEALDAQEILQGLVSVVRNRAYVPVFVSAGSVEIGIGPLLEAVINLMPSPADVPPVVANGKGGEEELPAVDAGPLAVYIWKTTAESFCRPHYLFRHLFGYSKFRFSGVESNERGRRKVWYCSSSAW